MLNANRDIQRTPAHTRSQVLTHALNLFTGQGYFNTSVHDIAHASKVSVGSIYHHFKDKEGIARTLYEELLTQMVEEITDILRNHTTAHSRCRAITELLFEITVVTPETMEFIIYAKHREFLPGEFPICSSKPFVMMREIVAEGMETGEIHTMDPSVATACLFGGSIRLITGYLDGVLEKRLPEYLEETWTCGWRAVAVV